jgi:hypothetical protein
MSWVESAYGITLTPFQRAAVELLCRSLGCGPYDMGNTFKTARWNHGKGVAFNVACRGLATFDSAGLTTLVIGAHEEAMRVSISAASFTHITIEIHPREREGDFSKKHPSIEDAVRSYKSTYPDRLRPATSASAANAEATQ